MAQRVMLPERGRLDLTVEAVIHNDPKWHALFTQEELAVCTKRLKDYRSWKKQIQVVMRTITTYSKRAPFYNAIATTKR